MPEPPPPTPTQQHKHHTHALSAVQVDTLVHAVQTLVRSRYVHKQHGETMARTVEARHAFAEYDHCALDACTLAAVLTSDLISVSGDTRVLLRYDSAEPARDIVGDAAREDEQDESTEYASREERLQTLTLGQWGHSDEDVEDEGSGIGAVEVLAGNIGCITLTHAAQSPDASAFFAAAMTLVRNTDALIIDIRNTTGRSNCADLLAYLAPQPPQPHQQLSTTTTTTEPSNDSPYAVIFHRPTNTLHQERIPEAIQYPSYTKSLTQTTAASSTQQQQQHLHQYPNKRIFILTSATGTHASAECLAFFLKELNTAAVTVGQSTRGNTLFMEAFRIDTLEQESTASNNKSAGMFTLEIPVGACVSSKSGKSWESGKGVAADHECAEEDARDVAYLMGLNANLARLERRRALQDGFSASKGVENSVLKDCRRAIQQVEARLAASRGRRGDKRWVKKVTLMTKKVVRGGVEMSESFVSDTKYVPVD
ncbi:hypothetical protein HDU77_010955 [Chytriomyces hyalinus]|nr:hypothetical protein HDU77_010955 [Chytriomyces hyalinus]